MRNIGLSLCLIFFATRGEALAVNQEILVERATEEEARQVQEVSNAFERRMRETRDAGSLKDLFLNDFMRLQIDEKKASGPDQALVLIESIPVSIKAELTAEVTQQEWERFYAAKLNLRYYFILLLVSRLKPNDIENGKKELTRELFPPEVLSLLQANAFLRQEYGRERDHKKYKIEAVEELRLLITTLEQATLILRQRFLKHPPEHTRIYEENLRAAPNKEKTSSTRLIWPDVYGTRESRLGFPMGTRFFHRITADSLFELWFVKTDNGMKIVWAQVYPFN